MSYTIEDKFCHPCITHVYETGLREVLYNPCSVYISCNVLYTYNDMFCIHTMTCLYLQRLYHLFHRRLVATHPCMYSVATRTLQQQPCKYTVATSVLQQQRYLYSTACSNMFCMYKTYSFMLCTQDIFCHPCRIHVFRHFSWQNMSRMHNMKEHVFIHVYDKGIPSCCGCKTSSATKHVFIHVYDKGDLSYTRIKTCSATLVVYMYMKCCGCKTCSTCHVG